MFLVVDLNKALGPERPKARSGAMGGRSEMEIREGDHVRVNLAPFIGSVMRSKQSVPCRVLSIDGIHVEVCTEHPCRELSLWVLASWVEEVVVSAAAPTRA